MTAEPLIGAALLVHVAGVIAGVRPGRRVLVAVDGVDGAGKTTFADALGPLVEANRPVLRASVDAFHRPAAQRYRRGRDSPEGYFFASYDYAALQTELLEPFAAGGSVVPGIFDWRTDTPRRLPAVHSAPDTVLIIDGIFLHRDTLVGHWHLSVFLDVDFTVSVPRGASRGYGDPDPASAANRRYVVGQRRYLAECDPRARATYVIDNNADRPMLRQ